MATFSFGCSLISFVLIYLLKIFFSFNQQVPIVFNGQITLFVAIIVNRALFCFVDVSKIVKVKSFLSQFLATHLRFTAGVCLHQYASVFAQHVVHISDVVGFITVQFVVVSHSALV